MAPTVWQDVLRNQILSRRERLQAAMGMSRESARMTALLQEIDAVLDKVDHGSFGLCEHCHGPIEHERLLADPLCCTCLDCMSEPQKRALEQDLELAGRIQSGLLPKATRVDGWEVCFHYRAAGPVSGDYCDLIVDENSARMMFLVGDVAGKGVAASLLMAHLHAMFRSLALFTEPVSDLVRKANRILSETTLASHYATLACGCAQPAGEVTVCNAGHCPPLLVTAAGGRELEPTGLPLGLFATAEYTCHSVSLAPGDLLALYTDGLSEAEDAGGGQYGADRLCGVLCRLRALPAEELMSACIEDVTRFCGRAPGADDVTLMLLRRR